MARGKEALAAANRRHEAAVQHIDRLTTELADAKIRAREVEKQACKVPHLEARVAELQRELEAHVNGDPVVRELEKWVDYLQEYRKSWENLSAERWAAVRGLAAEVFRSWDGVIRPPRTQLDKVEYLARRFPVLFNDTHLRERPHRPKGTPRHLSDDAVRRLQVARRERDVVELEGSDRVFNMAEFLDELDQLKEARWSIDDIREYFEMNQVGEAL